MNVPVDKIIKLARQGINDSQIIRQLKQEGYTPRQINDAFNQAKVKLELEKTNVDVPQPSEEMQQSIADSSEEQENISASQIDSPQESKYEGNVDVPQPTQEEQTAEVYPYQYPSYSPRASAEDMEELVGEMVDEKWQEFKKKTGNIEEVKDRAEQGIKNFDKRVQRSETFIKKMEEAVRQKFKEQGDEIKLLRADVMAIKETLNKIMKPLILNVKRQTGMLDLDKEVEKKPKVKEKIITKKREKSTIESIFSKK